jgi:hypothetical protein
MSGNLPFNIAVVPDAPDVEVPFPEPGPVRRTPLP